MLLAALDPAASGGGALGLLIIVLLIVATVFLIRNMNSRLKRMPRSFDSPPDEEGQPPSGEPRT